MPIEKGWVNLLQQTLNEQNKPYTLINKSISGDTTAGGLARIDQALEQHTPEIVLLELGANDGLRGMPPTLIKKNLRELVKRIKANGAQTLFHQIMGNATPKCSTATTQSWPKKWIFLLCRLF